MFMPMCIKIAPVAIINAQENKAATKSTKNAFVVL